MLNAKDVRWHGKKVAKHYPSIDFSILSSVKSSSSSELGGSNVDEGGEAMSLVS